MARECRDYFIDVWRIPAQHWCNLLNHRLNSRASDHPHAGFASASIREGVGHAARYERKTTWTTAQSSITGDEIDLPIEH
jgi:hypothetical protein